MATVTVAGVSVVKGERTVLVKAELSVRDGELLVIVGPSGAGKTTLLRAVAGLDEVAAGEVVIDGRVVTDEPTAERGLAMVFHENSLLSFTTARRNVSFPLEIAGRDPEEVADRVDAEARVLAIEHILERRPNELSRGHQQLVQAARAMVQVPDVFLMDEPLAQMDAGLRELVRNELRLLQSGYGVTTLWATNDPVEAMAIADRVVVLDRGSIRAIGDPAALYAEPPNEFTALALGDSPMRIVDGDVQPVDERWEIRAGALRVLSDASTFASVAPGRVRVGVRPADLVERPGGVPARVVRTEFHGDSQMVDLDVGGASLQLRDDHMGIGPGDVLEVGFERVHVFDPATRDALAHVSG